MKTTHKKMKKRESLKTDRENAGQQSNLSSPEMNVVLPEKKRSGQPDERKTYDAKQKKNKQGLAFINNIIQFLRDAKVELKKVKWPTRKELLASTVMVLILVIAVSVYLGIVDFFLNMIINKFVG